VPSHPLPGRWFRIPYARNAFVRLLAAHGLALEALTVEQGEEWMRRFFAEHKPQHAESDRLTSAARPVRGHHERVFARRMQRHDHPVSTLRLVFELDGDGEVLDRRLELRTSVPKAHA